MIRLSQVAEAAVEVVEVVEAAEAEVAVAVAEVIAFRGYSFRLEYDEIFLTNFVKSYSISFGNTKRQT